VKRNKNSDILEAHRKVTEKVIGDYSEAIEPFVQARQDALRQFRIECNQAINQIVELRTKAEEQLDTDYLVGSQKLESLLEQTLNRLADIRDAAISTSTS